MKLKKRKAIIDEELCDGCGLCVPSCHEGAIVIEDGKARIIEELCDGIGDCLRECPKGAIKIIEEEEEVDFQWPVKLRLIRADSPLLRTSKITFMADCSPVANPELVRKSFEEGAVLLLCPKFDELEEHERKIREIMERNRYDEIRVIRMVVPCCRGISSLIEKILHEKSSENLKEFIVFPDGRVQENL
ncbi:MAG: 4Fe-4S binding protein [Archaeoglobi archaeon]|nr:4Fe-4S binding protein [Candidatus Mnemosynella sp.]